MQVLGNSDGLLAAFKCQFCIFRGNLRLGNSVAVRLSASCLLNSDFLLYLLFKNKNKNKNASCMV